MNETSITTRSFDVAGVGLHSGVECSVQFTPLSPGKGLLFSSGPFRPHYRLDDLDTVSAPLRTRLLVGDSPVDTVEHLMAALAISGLTDTLVTFNGPEVPILDGSAAPWLEEIGKACVPGSYPSSVDEFVVTRPVEYDIGDSHYEASPGDACVTVIVDYRGSWIGEQSATFLEEGFPDMARARTFCREADLEPMAAAGLGLGGSLSNAIVVGANGPLNPEGLRMPNEFAAHKALDLVGDLFLAGGRVVGNIVAHRPGHSANNAFMRSMIEDGVLVPATRASEALAISA